MMYEPEFIMIIIGLVDVYFDYGIEASHCLILG